MAGDVGAESLTLGASWAGVEGTVEVNDLAFEGSSADPCDIARFAMVTLLGERRVPTEACPPSGICEPCIDPHIQKLTDAAEDEKPLQFMLLGFPCKSPNPAKVLGELPDMAEIISLQHLHGLTHRVKAFYEPGAEIIIGADGRAFVDLVEVPDDTVTAYIHGIRGIIRDTGLSINYVGMDDLLPDIAERGDYDGLREALQDNAASIDTLHDRSQDDPSFKYMVNGIERFLTDDLRPLYPELSKSQLKKMARQRAYEIIRRGDVLRDELETRFPSAARLSIHPQPSHNGKLGVRITPSSEDRSTPWHSAALREQAGSFRLVRRQQAEEQGARVVHFDNGQPSHLELASTA